MSEVQRPMMTTERFIRIFAGAVVLLSLGLGVQGSPIFVSQNFLWLTAFVGLNLFQSGFTRLCPLETILRRVFKMPSGEGGAACNR